MSFLTFTPPIAPSAGMKTKPKLKLLKAEFGEGYSSTTGDGLNHIRQELTLSWETLSADQAGAITSFLLARRGYEPFYYTPADGERRLWTCEEWEDTHQGTHHSVSATFIQSFAL